MTAEDGQSGRAQPSEADLRRRLDSLSRDLESEKRERVAAERPSRSESGSYGVAFKLGSEFIAAVVVGAALGWAIDYVAGTSPWGMIVFLLLGFCTGVMAVMRSAGGMGGSGAGRTGG